MFCEYCGTPIDDNAKVCPNCGKPVADDVFVRAGAGSVAGNVSNAVNGPGTEPHDPFVGLDSIGGNPGMGESYYDNPYTGAGSNGNTVGMDNPYMGADMPSGNGGYVPPNPNLGSNPFDQQVDPRINPAAAARAVGNSVRNLVLADGEVIVRQYRCADVFKSQGILTVSNKRVMFHAVAEKSRLTQEVWLASIKGLRCYYGTNYDLKRIIIGAIVALFGIIFMVNTSRLFAQYSYDGGGGGGLILLGLLITAIGALLIFLGIQRSFMVSVYAEDVKQSSLSIGRGPTSIIGNFALFAFNTTRNQETDQMIDELGAMIQDLQTIGDLAIEKWQRSGGSGFSSLPNL